jgi:hypothetical protein
VTSRRSDGPANLALWQGAGPFLRLNARLGHFLPQKRAARLGISAFLLFLSFLFCVPASAQLHFLSCATSPEIPKDAHRRYDAETGYISFFCAARRGDDDSPLNF